MEFKTWHFALAGFAFPFILLLNFIVSLIEYGKGNDPAYTNLMLMVTFFVAIISGIPVLLLYFEKTKKIGAVVSVILGLVSIMALIGFMQFSRSLFFIIGILNVFASILYFGNKRITVNLKWESNSLYFAFAGFVIFFVQLFLDIVSAIFRFGVGSAIDSDFTLIELKVSALSTIVLLSLYFERTRMLGSILSIIFGIGLYLGIKGVLPSFTLIGVLEILAGLSYFWEKLKPVTFR